MQGEILKFGSIKLRPLEPEDIDLLYNWENDSAIWEVSNTKTPFSKHLLAQFIKDSANDIYTTKQLRLIIETTGKKVVGAIDLFEFEPYHRRAGIGILIHKFEDRGKGYASDALISVCNYASEVLGIHQLFANISEENSLSIGLFEKCGFKISGNKTDWLHSVNGWKNELFLQKLF